MPPDIVIRLYNPEQQYSRNKSTQSKTKEYNKGTLFCLFRNWIIEIIDRTEQKISECGTLFRHFPLGNRNAEHFSSFCFRISECGIFFVIKIFLFLRLTYILIRISKLLVITIGKHLSLFHIFFFCFYKLKNNNQMAISPVTAYTMKY